MADDSRPIGPARAVTPVSRTPPVKDQGERDDNKPRRRRDPPRESDKDDPRGRHIDEIV